MGLFLRSSIVTIEVLPVVRTTSRDDRSGFAFALLLFTPPPRTSRVRTLRWSLFILQTKVPFRRGYREPRHDLFGTEVFPKSPIFLDYLASFRNFHTAPN